MSISRAKGLIEEKLTGVKMADHEINGSKTLLNVGIY
jgi:hypothetical protein